MSLSEEFLKIKMKGQKTYDISERRSKIGDIQAQTDDSEWMINLHTEAAYHQIKAWTYGHHSSDFQRYHQL